jgi:hypothetical protein
VTASSPIPFPVDSTADDGAASRRAGDTPGDPGQSEAEGRRLAFTPPDWLDRALEAAIVAAKAATVVCAIDGFVNADTPRLRGKGIRARAFGYTGALLLVPAIWRLLPDRGRYPRGLDLAVTLPLLIDASGNALGLYNDAHLDDVVHFLNSAIVAGVAGALFATRTDDPWLAAVAGTGTAISGETIWEIGEYVAMRAGATGMGLTYQDTIADLADSTLGAIVGGIVTWLRMPREKEQRSRGWRHAVGGWRAAGEPVSLVGAPGSVAERAIGRTVRRATKRLG